MTLETAIEERKQKISFWRRQGVEPYGQRFLRTHTVGKLLDNFCEGERVRVCGRLVSIRRHGSAAFAHIKDGGASIQIYAKKDVLEDYRLFLQLDVGDIIGVEGETFTTRTGEPTVLVKEFVLLAKALRPLPEKWHGLKDQEVRLRQRYLDIMVNEEVRERFENRAKIITLLREFLQKEGFLEVETPMMHHVASGAAARPFTTYHNALGLSLYLRIAPELHLKRLLVAGFDRIYELGRSFRNEGLSGRHNPEFLLLEVYQAYADYTDMMQLLEEMTLYIVKGMFGKEEFVYQGQRVCVTPPWRRLKVDEILQIVGMKEEEQIQRFCKEQGIEREDAVEQIIDKVFVPQCIEPTIIMDYPQHVCPLAKRKKGTELIERFEVVVGGLEIANAYTELNDPLEQKERFLKQSPEQFDADFVEALEYGMPPAAGLGVGIDRVVMLLTDASSIRDVIIFPLLRPKDA
jgi:lysyl-tRNA synthetase class 2